MEGFAVNANIIDAAGPRPTMLGGRRSGISFGGDRMMDYPSPSSSFNALGGGSGGGGAWITMITIAIATAGFLVVVIIGDDNILDACSIYVVFWICSENIDKGREGV